MLVVDIPGKYVFYLYDGLHRRFEKRDGATVIERYIWQDQLRLAAVMNPDNTIKQQFIYADGVNSPDYMYSQGKKYHFVKDHRGSIIMVVDIQNGNIIQKLTYSEFGEVIEDTNPGFQTFGFAGGPYDHDTKLVKSGRRDYDGRIGRWLSKDPIGFEGGDANLYGYVLNDPVNFVDPTGKFPMNMEEAMECIYGNPKGVTDLLEYNIQKNKNTIAELSNQISGGPVCISPDTKDQTIKQIKRLKHVNNEFQKQVDQINSKCSYFFKNRKID